ncbi:hypothetical protein D3C75_835330 [compost metagenome]
MQYLDSSLLEGSDEMGWITARRFHTSDARIQDDPGTVFRPHAELGQDRQVDAKRLAREAAGFLDFFVQRSRGREAVGGQKPQPACVGNRGHKLGARHITHAALDQGILDTEQFSDSGLEHDDSLEEVMPGPTVVAKALCSSSAP